MSPRQKPNRSEQTVSTPPEFLAAVSAQLGPIAVDLAATRENAVAPIWIGPELDSLMAPWVFDVPRGSVLWLNPPFGRIGPWVEKCRAVSDALALRGHVLAALLPASIGAAWYWEHVHPCAAVWALAPRLTFVGHQSPYPKDLVLALYGFGCSSSLHLWRWDRKEG